MNDTVENGSELSQQRKAAVQYGLEQHNHVADERDAFEKEVRDLRMQVAGYKVAMDAMEVSTKQAIDERDMRIAALENQMQSQRAERDQAVADRAVYETLFRASKVLYDEFVPPQSFLSNLLRERFTPTELQQQAIYRNPYFGDDKSASEQSRSTVKPIIGENKNYPPHSQYPRGIGGSGSKLPDTERSS
jgi:uncharacterized small protein (DUF1192 family)